MRWFQVPSILASPALAEGRLDNAAIVAALTGKVLTFCDGATQSFKADVQTIYTNGTDSIGHWRVEAGRYCAVWLPSDHWACQDVKLTGYAGLHLWPTMAV